jgi:hypothetical protein
VCTSSGWRYNVKVVEYIQVMSSKCIKWKWEMSVYHKTSIILEAAWSILHVRMRMPNLYGTNKYKILSISKHFHGSSVRHKCSGFCTFSLLFLIFTFNDFVNYFCLIT